MDEFFEEVDEDVEFSEEDFISEDELEEEVGEKGEAFVFPFSSIFINKLPEKFNPMKVFKSKEIILYNPNEKITPYNKVIPAALTLNMLKDNFIVSSISMEQNSSLRSFAGFSKILNDGFKPIIDTYIQYENSKQEEEMENTNSPNNKNTNGFKPKPQKPQGSTGRKYKKKYNSKYKKK